jgi:2-polyprenyl-3-methyl-5-hydroxy-6-metoxy-1,4-benzoquinol methylase
MHAANNYHAWIVEEIKPYLGKTTAEVGAGIGNISKLLEKHVEHLTAFEPNNNLIQKLKMSLNGKSTIINSILTPKLTFDSIVYINVLEHIKNDRIELLKARNALTDNGHLIIFVPALQWLYSDFDRSIGHYRRYNKKQLTTLIKEAGFEVIKAKYLDMPGILPWLINFTLLGKSLNERSARTYDKLVPLVRFGEGLINPPIGKNLLVVGKR